MPPLPPPSPERFGLPLAPGQCPSGNTFARSAMAQREPYIPRTPPRNAPEDAIAPGPDTIEWTKNVLM
eukprot:1945206-Alexandrium_andersonii.AAC.1